MKWPDDGLCLTGEHKSKFTSHDPADIVVAKDICNDCPVKVQCVSYMS